MGKPVTTASKSYFIYIVRCADDSLYTGITQNIKTRLEEHNTNLRGAKYTRSRRPVKLVFSKIVGSRSAALQEEWRIKKLSRTQKLHLAGILPINTL